MYAWYNALSFDSHWWRMYDSVLLYRTIKLSQTKNGVPITMLIYLLFLFNMNKSIQIPGYEWIYIFLVDNTWKLTYIPGFFKISKLNKFYNVTIRILKNTKYHQVYLLIWFLIGYSVYTFEIKLIPQIKYHEVTL